jgi:hypothetical protein
MACSTSISTTDCGYGKGVECSLFPLCNNYLSHSSSTRKYYIFIKTVIRIRWIDDSTALLLMAHIPPEQPLIHDIRFRGGENSSGLSRKCSIDKRRAVTDDSSSFSSIKSMISCSSISVSVSSSSTPDAVSESLFVKVV